MTSIRQQKAVLSMSDPSQSTPDPPIETPDDASDSQLTQEDFYYEGANLVFTASYHLKRGFCCNCHCRHCPYR